jgi:hypothetical protein
VLAAIFFGAWMLSFKVWERRVAGRCTERCPTIQDSLDTVIREAERFVRLFLSIIIGFSLPRYIK